jgi:hypothetical protein
MAGLTNFAEQKALEKYFRNTAYTPASTIYLRLYSVLPADDGTGGTDLTGETGYSAQTVAFGAYSSRRITNSGTVSFTNSGGGDWPTVVGYGLATAASGGDLLAVGTIAPNATVGAGATLSLTAGEVFVQVSKFGPYLAQSILDLLFRNTIVSVTTVYAALFSVAPSDDGTGGTEISASGYTRKSASFAAYASGRCYLSSNVSFTTNAPAAWGAIAAVAYYTASSGGSFMVQSAISPVPTVGLGSPFALSSADTYVGLD